MIDATTNIANQTAIGKTSSTQLTSGAESGMGKEEFLKLLVAQLQNQDPLKPQDNSEFVAELAQFSNLEQVIGINDRLDALSTQNQGLQNSQIVSMVGKNVTVKGSMVTADGSGSPVPVSFSMEGVADTVTVKIADLSGRPIRTIEVGKKGVGRVDLQWNGRTDDGLVAPKGTYTVQVSAKNAAGSSIATSQETTGTVKSVSFDKGYPVLQLSSGVSVPISDLLKVSQ
jgi:flagellar basal-body rod modification protein FlgD